LKERFETFTVLINRISRSIRKIKNREMEEFGLRSSHISCIYYLFEEKGLTAAEICERCEEDKATVSRSLDYLEKNGYITCETKGAKKYKAPLQLTEKGRAVGEHIAGKIDQVLDSVSICLSESERAEFYRSLAVISDGLDKICNEALKGSNVDE